MSLTQGLEYSFTVCSHAQLTLAWRYGIVDLTGDNEEKRISAFFNRLISEQDNGRIKARFSMGQQKSVDLIVDIERMEVITALPRSRQNPLDASDGAKCLAMLDAVKAFQPEAFNAKDVIQWRLSFLEGNGRFTKDNLRRELRKKGFDFRLADPFETLAIDEDFFAQVTKLRVALRDMYERYPVETLDTFDGHEGFEQILKLAGCNRTDLGIYEYPGAQTENSTEISGSFHIPPTDNSADRHPWVALASARFGLPNCEPVLIKTLDGANIYCIPEAEFITSAVDHSLSDNWHRLYYRYNDEYYFLCTRYTENLSAYDRGRAGIFYREYNDSSVRLIEFPRYR